MYTCLYKGNSQGGCCTKASICPHQRVVQYKQMLSRLLSQQTDTCPDFHSIIITNAPHRSSSPSSRSTVTKAPKPRRQPQQQPTLHTRMPSPSRARPPPPPLPRRLLQAHTLSGSRQGEGGQAGPLQGEGVGLVGAEPPVLRTARTAAALRTRPWSSAGLHSRKCSRCQGPRQRLRRWLWVQDKVGGGHRPL